MDKIVTNFDTINDISEMIQNNHDNIDPRVLSTIEDFKNITYNQKGGFAGILKEILQWIIEAVKALGMFILELLKDLFYLPWRKDELTGQWKNDKGQFWWYMYFCFKCGLCLVVFAIFGPLFMLYGIFLIYGKLFRKMNEDPNTSPASFMSQRMDNAATI